MTVLGTQRVVLATLGEILGDGQRADAEPIVWTVGFEGVTGEVHVYSGHQRTRAVFDQWVRVIGAHVQPEHTTSDGTVLLVAHRRHITAAGRFVVVLRADLRPLVLRASR